MYDLSALTHDIPNKNNKLDNLNDYLGDFCLLHHVKSLNQRQNLHTRITGTHSLQTV